MDKRTFTGSVRKWEFDVVSKALTEDCGLATFTDKVGKTPLHHCAQIDARKFGLNVSDSLKTASALLASGADVNAIRVIVDEGNEFHASPLWYAIAWGKNFELARLLLEHGAKPDDNATGAAIWDQDLRLAELLRSHGGNINQVFRGETPLLRNVRAKRLRLVKWLIDNGADINFQDARGYSALHYAVKRSLTLRQVEELLAYGARANLEAKDGSTPISLAEAGGKSRMAALVRRFARSE